MISHRVLDMASCHRFPVTEFMDLQGIDILTCRNITWMPVWGSVRVLPAYASFLSSIRRGWTRRSCLTLTFALIAIADLHRFLQS